MKINKNIIHVHTLIWEYVPNSKKQGFKKTKKMNIANNSAYLW